MPDKKIKHKFRETNESESYEEAEIRRTAVKARTSARRRFENQIVSSKIPGLDVWQDALEKVLELRGGRGVYETGDPLPGNNRKCRVARAPAGAGVNAMFVLGGARGGYSSVQPLNLSALTFINERMRLRSTTGETTVVEPLSDHHLLEATGAGDEAAFAELVRRYRNPITNYIYRLTNDYETAIDLAQESFVRVYKAADRYQTSHAFSTYIYTIATNLAISELRRRKRRRIISLTGFFQGREGSESAYEFDPPDGRPLQDAVLIEDERRAAVARAIATLPEKYRAPLVLRDIENRSYEQIAQILGMSEGTVKSRISRARSFLRDKLRAYL